MPKKCTLTNRGLYCLAFTGTFQGVLDVFSEWGSLFVLTQENKVILIFSPEDIQCVVQPLDETLI